MTPPRDPVVRVRSERLVAGGAALARDDTGRVVFAAGAAADEVVDVRITSTRRNVAHGIVEAVIEASEDRVAAPCPQVALGCGGCDWQHLAVDAQRRGRRAIVRESLVRLGRLDAAAVDRALERGAAPHDATPLPSAGARTTLRLAVDIDGRVGFRTARSHEVVPTHHCLVAHPALESLLPTLRLPGASEVNLRVAVATGERAMWWTPADVPPPTDLPADVLTGADAVVHEVIAGTRLRVSAGSFFQPSPQAATAIVAAVARASAAPLAAMAPDDLVIDAYAGVGLLAATVVPAERPVLAVEGSRSACADAEVNLTGRNARVLRCAVERWRPEPARLVIADPARSGLGADACRRLVAARPTDVVLVSCDPAAFGRDASLLTGSGYELVSCEVLDAFPHTHHVEVVSHFSQVRATQVA
jgi:23S rRNA (uracil1939-C5)-methyltransferase